MTFSDQVPGWELAVDSAPDKTFDTSKATDDSLGSFLSRPIKILTTTYAPGSDLARTFNPWMKFFQDPRVANRIANYNLLRCKLCVKFVINGAPFHSGRVLVSYMPLAPLDPYGEDTNIWSYRDNVILSQKPHIFLNPTDCSGGTLELPFFWRFNYVCIPKEEYIQLGKIQISQLMPLRAINGSNESAHIAVYAWATDVHLQVPTCLTINPLPPQQLPYTAQSGVVDEYSTGVVSKPASAVANIAGSMTMVPLIGPYARATQMAASAISGIARLFGFSRPAIIQDIQPYVPRYLGNLANTDAGDTTMKATFDLKQEVTVDPRTMGLGAIDEMSIKYIASKETYLTNMTWTTSSGQGQTIGTFAVTPNVWNASADPPIYGTKLYFPAVCTAVAPFTYWRGTMKYRFMFGASQFHKGRLRIVWDPLEPKTNSALGSYNVAYNVVVDLADTQDFEFTIGWGQEFPYCRTLPTFKYGKSELPWSTTAGTIPTSVSYNGIFKVQVVTPLMSFDNNLDNTIEIAVFVSCADLEVAEPTNYKIHSLSTQIGSVLEHEPSGESETFVAQSGLLTPGNFDKPESRTATFHLGPESEPFYTAEFNSVWFGDPIKSLRQLLKRYVGGRTLIPNRNSVGAMQVSRFVISDITPPFGYYAKGVYISTRAGGLRCNIEPTTPLTFFQTCYMARRGGMRFKYVLSNFATADNESRHLMGVMIVNRAPMETKVSQQSIPMNGGALAQQRSASLQPLIDDMWSGGVATTISRNPVVEVEMPYYNHERFFLSRDNVGVTNTITAGTFHELKVTNLTVAASYPSVAQFVSVADDFSLGFWVGQPIMYELDFENSSGIYEGPMAKDSAFVNIT